MELEREVIYPPPSPPTPPTPEAVEEPPAEERRSKTPSEKPTSPVAGGDDTIRKSNGTVEGNEGSSNLP